MKYLPKQYAQALMDALESSGPKDEGQVLDNFVKVLAENNHLRMLDAISEEFHRLELAKKGLKQAEVTTAHPINRENEQGIIREFNKLVKGDLILKKKIDENLIGGVIIKVDDQMLDASIKNDLEQLKNSLTQ